MSRKRAKRRMPARPAPSPEPESVGAAHQDPYVGGGERLKLPHERDESPTDLAKHGERGAGQRELVEQAKDDLDRGLVDTDCLAPHGSESPCPPTPDVEPNRKPQKPRTHRR